MIVELTVENLAIIERAHLHLRTGFTALTGETGAGKSLLIDAVELALGGRAGSELVRTGTSRATVTMTVDLSARPKLIELCKDLGVPVDDDLLTIQREVLAEGKSTVRIAGKLFPVATLRSIGSQLVDLHGQHDHQSLLDPNRHLEFLDGWIGELADELKLRIASNLEKTRLAERRLSAVRSGQRELEQRIDLLTYQIADIEAIAPIPGETEELELQLQRLKHAEKLATAGSEALHYLSDGETNVVDLLGEALRSLDGVIRFDATLDPLVEPLRIIQLNLQEAVYGVRDYVEGLEADPTALDRTVERMDALRKLRRKYGDDEAAILAHLASAREELEGLTFGGEDEESLANELSIAEQALDSVCVELSLIRKERAVQFAQFVQDTLAELAMERAIFEVAFASAAVDASGTDRIEFYFSANAGEVPRPLAKIASGGELSRVMLAIKTAFAGKAGVPTLIFDEVDAGLGGRAAVAVARKIEMLGEHYQVLVISHLPQIASRADHHYRIAKAESHGRVVATIEPLADRERVSEIARMLGGEVVSEAALANARELLQGKVQPTSLFE